MVDYARSRRAIKRGPEHKVELDDGLDLPQKQHLDIVALDDALNALSRRDAQQEQIVELRFFGGLTVGETAEVLDVSAATVKRAVASLEPPGPRATRWYVVDSVGETFCVP